MQDGVAENGTAAMLTPYLDVDGRETGNRGHSFVEAGALREAVAALDAAGFQVHVHAIGDRASREALDAFEGTLAGPPAPHRAHPGRAPRRRAAASRALGVAANAQALWACEDEQMTQLTLPFLGPERAAWQYPFGDLHRAGARLVMGSDWPVSTPDPLQAMHVAVNRTAYGEQAEPFLPGQAARPGDRLRGVHVRLGLDQPPRRDRRGRRARARCRRRPGRAGPRPVRRAARGDRRLAGGVDLDRRRDGLHR